MRGDTKDLKVVAGRATTLLGGWVLYWGYMRRDGKSVLLPYRSMQELNEKAPFVRFVRGPFLARGAVDGYSKLDAKMARAIAGAKSTADQSLTYEEFNNLWRS